MLKQCASAVLLTALLGTLPTSASGLYTKKSPVLQVDASNYDTLIAQSNYVSVCKCSPPYSKVIELTIYPDRRVRCPNSISPRMASYQRDRFYAPWCGHCQNLKPAYEKAAKSLEGLAKVAAINCDEESNKAFCGHMRVKGFPTIRLVVPSDKTGKPHSEEYQGPRTAKGIVDAVVEKIPNHVKRLTDKDLDSWLKSENGTAKAILFTEKGTTSALLRALAIDFLGKIQIGQVRSKETSAVGKFGITKYPTLVLLPGSDKPSIEYDGELKKNPMLEFLKQAADPNPDPPVSNTKSKKPAKSATKKRTVYVGDETTATPKPSDSPDDGTASEEPTGSSAPPTKPRGPPPLRILSTSTDLRTTCLSSKTGTCILAVVPVPKDPGAAPPPGALDGLSALSEIEHKHTMRGGHIFPFYVLPDDIEEVSKVKSELDLKSTFVEIIAINGKRGWWRRYDSADGTKYNAVDLEKWIDQIRFGEGKKNKLPEGIIPADKAKSPENEAKKDAGTPPQDAPEPEPEPEQAPEPEATSSAKPESSAEPVPEPEAASSPEPIAEQENIEPPKETKTAVHEEL